METQPAVGARVTVPFNVKGETLDVAGTVVAVHETGTKAGTQVTIKLDEHGGEEVRYPLDAVDSLPESD